MRIEIRQAFALKPSITQDGTRTVITVPWGWPQSKIQETIESFFKKQPLPVRKRRRKLTMEELYGVSFTDGQEIELLSQKFKIEVHKKQTDVARAKIQWSTAIITIPENLTPKEEKQVINELARKVLAKEIQGSLEKYIHVLNQQHFGSPLGRITIRLQGSRWGSCSIENNLNFNFMLLTFPREILNYVIIHELAHTKVRDHSRLFWEEVARAFPEYKSARKWLKEWMQNRIRELKKSG